MRFKESAGTELEILSRAHDLFAGVTRDVSARGTPEDYDRLLKRTAEINTGGGQHSYQLAVQSSRAALRSATDTDATMLRIVADARRDHADSRQRTADVLAQARADGGAATDSPVAQREAMRRRASRLRAQHAHVSYARARARRRLALLRALRFLVSRRRAGWRGLRLPAPDSRAGIAVRAALSRLGRPYVWGATGPDRFDCSGLVQWSYGQAGIHLDRTTYDQINDGIPVPRSQVRPGDLVFPHAGHVQLAIGNNLVVEAPHAGATVRISQLGQGVQIRRPA